MKKLTVGYKFFYSVVTDIDFLDVLYKKSENVRNRSIFAIHGSDGTRPDIVSGRCYFTEQNIRKSIFGTLE
jgi:hypothetical protein